MSRNLNVALRIGYDGRPMLVGAQQSQRALDDIGAAGERAGTRVTAGMAKAEREVGGLSETVREMRQSFIGLAVIGTATALVVQFGGGVLTATQRLEGYDRALESATGGTRLAAEAMAFVRAETDRLGGVLDANAQGFTRLSAATRGTKLEGEETREIFLGLAEASRVLNLSADDTLGAITAVEQMISKGKVSAEELRGQLGERLPGAFRIAAEAMGMTTQELDKALSTGDVLAEDLLPRLADRLRELYGAGAADAAQSPSAELNRLQNALVELQSAIGNAGVLDAVAAGARDLREAIEALVASGALPALVSSLGTLVQLGVAAVLIRIAEAARTAGAAKVLQAQQTLAAVAAERAQIAASVQAAAAQAAEASATLRVIEAARAAEIAKVRGAQAEIAAAQATLSATAAIGAQSAALRAARIATEELALAKVRLTAATTALATLGAQQARIEATLATAATAQVAAQTALAGAATRTSVAMGMLQRAGQGVVALLGGPWGAAAFVAVGGLLALNAALEDNEEWQLRITDAQRTSAEAWRDAGQAIRDSVAAIRAANPDLIQRDLERNNVLLEQATQRADAGGESAALYAAKVRILADRQRELTDELRAANPALAEQARTLTAGQDAISAAITDAQERVVQLRRQIAEARDGARGGLLADLRELSRQGIASPDTATREQREQIRGLLADLPKLEAELAGVRDANRAMGRATSESNRAQKEQERTLADQTRALEALSRIQVRAASELEGPVTRAWRDYRAGVDAANEAAREARDASAALQAGAVSEAEIVARLAGTLDALADARDRELRSIRADTASRRSYASVVDAGVAGIVEETRQLRLTNTERAVEEAMLAAAAAARQQYIDGQRESLALTAEETAAIRQRVEAEAGTQDVILASRAAADDYQRTWLQSIDSVAQAFGDWIADGARSFSDFGRALVNIAKRAIADILAQFARAQLGRIFGLDAGGGASSFSSLFGAAGGSGAGAGAGSAGGMLGNLGASMSQLFTQLMGNPLTAAALVFAGGSSIARALGGNGTAGGMLGGLVGSAFGTSFRPTGVGGTDVRIGSGGVSGSQFVEESRRRSFWRGTERRTVTSALDADAAADLDAFYAALRASNQAAANELRTTVPPLIEAAWREVRDSAGNVVSQTATVLGRTYNETFEQFGTRVQAEGLIAVVDRALGGTVEAAAASAGDAIGRGIAAGAEGGFDAGGGRDVIGDLIAKTVATAARTGEASAIAERWRNDADKLLEGAQFLVVAARDIQRGTALLGEGGSLTQIADLVEDLAASGETLTQTYVRLAGATSLLDRALAMANITTDQTREQIVRMATGIAEAAGGIDAAAQLWDRFFSVAYTESERITAALAQAEQARASVLAQAGLEVGSTLDQVRAAVEALLRDGGDPERIAQLLRAADAIARVTELQSQLAGLTPADAGAALLEEIMAGVEAGLLEFAPPATFAERLGTINREIDALIERAQAAGATIADIARIEELRAASLSRVEAERAAALAEYEESVAAIRREVDGAGLSEFGSRLRDIDEWARDTAAALEAQARAAGRASAAAEDLALVQEAAALRTAALVRQLESQGRSIAERLFGSPLGNLEQRIRELESTSGTTAGAVQSLGTTTEDTGRAAAAAVARIREYLDDMMLGQLGGLRPRDALAEAQRQFAALYARAQGGDVEALQALPQLNDTILRLGQQVYASGAPYLALRDQQRALLEALTGLQFGGTGGGGGSTGGGFVGGGGAGGGVSTELQALYAEREALLAQQAAAERRALALELVGIVADIVSATERPLTEIAASLGFTMDQLVEQLGVNLGELNATTAAQLADIAQDLGVNLSDLAASVGIDLGTLADAQSLLNDRLEAEIAALPADQRDQLEPLLRGVEEAALLGDNALVEQRMQALVAATNTLPPQFRNALAPLFAEVQPVEYDQLSALGSIDFTSVQMLDVLRQIEANTETTQPVLPPPSGPDAVSALMARLNVPEARTEGPQTDAELIREIRAMRAERKQADAEAEQSRRELLGRIAMLEQRLAESMDATRRSTDRVADVVMRK